MNKRRSHQARVSSRCVSPTTMYSAPSDVSSPNAVPASTIASPACGKRTKIQYENTPDGKKLAFLGERMTGSKQSDGRRKKLKGQLHTL